MTAPNTIYNVHIYREMRLFFPGIAAVSSEAAAGIAAGRPTHEAERVEDCEGDTLAALVDVEGDTEYAGSRVIDFEPQRLRNAAADLLDALRIIADDDLACSCRARSWYGAGHDTQCPVRVAGDAIARAAGPLLPNLHLTKGNPMTAFKTTIAAPDAVIDIDDRFRLVIRRSAPPPMASAQLVIRVYPITDGEVWDEPYEVFAVDEGRVIELENQAREE